MAGTKRLRILPERRKNQMFSRSELSESGLTSRVYEIQQTRSMESENDAEITGVPISALPGAASPTGNDVVAGVQSGVTKKFSLLTLIGWIRGQVSPSDIGAVPTSRTVNGKSLTSNITLNASDVGLGNVANERQYSAQNPPPPSVVVSSLYFPAGWIGSQGGTASPYHTDVGVPETLVITAHSKIDLQPTPSQIASLIAAGVEALLIENDNGFPVAWAVGEHPTAAMTIQCTVEETT